MENNASMLFSDWAKSWLVTKEKKVKPATIGTYRMTVLKRLIPLFGNHPVLAIEEKDIQMAIDNWEKEGNWRTGNGLSKKTVKEYVRILIQVLCAYYKKNALPRPFFDKFEFVSSSQSTEVAIFSTIEQAKIIKAVFNDITPKNIGIALGLLAGLRIGEVCGLKWDNIDIDYGILTINNTIQRVYLLDDSAKKGKTEVITGTPKSGSSNRTIPYGDTLSNLLKVIKPEHCDSCFVITGSEKNIEPKILRDYYYKFLKSLGIKKLSFHTLRHTYGSKLASCGVAPKTITKLMGHASVATTLKLYCHPQMEDMQNAIAVVDKKWM